MCENLMDIDLILSRADYQVPLFADFILDKYRDLKKTDPESARKIEARVFTRSFLLNILDNGDLFMLSLMFTHVPSEFFTPIMDELTDRFKNGSLSDYGKKIDIIIKAHAPGLFLDHLKQKFQEQIKQEQVTIHTFYWHNYFEDLPLDLKHEYFDQTLPLFYKASESLEDSPDFRAFLLNQTSAALILNRPEAVPLAKNCLEHLIRNYDGGDLNYYEFCRYFRLGLTPERFMSVYPFELDLFFALEDNELTTAPELLDHLYQDGWSGAKLFDLYSNILQTENLSENSMIPEHLTDINEPLLTSIIRTLIQDKALMLLLESYDLHRAVSAVFASIIRQFHRKDEIDPARFTDANVMEFITLDFEYIPLMAQIKTYLSGIATQRMTALLCTALEKSLDIQERERRGDYAIATVMELMAHFRDPSFVPGIVNVFLYNSGDDDWLPKKAINPLSGFGDAAIDCLDSKMGGIPESRLLDVLTIIRKVGTERAEEFLIKHFDRFIKSFRADTLSTCQSLVSQKALALLDHKVGKKQKGIDELYVIVNTLQGKADEKTQRILDTLPLPMESLNATMELLNSGIAQSVLTLALECSHCFDISDYECRNVIASPDGDNYVADELTCISCNRITEFTITPMGKMAASAELIRLTALKNQHETKDIPFTGALRFLNSAVRGKQMSISQGIALYKEEIRKMPKNPDHYIGLGNIYKTMNQYTFAEEHYKYAISHGPFYIEPYLSLAEIEYNKKDLKTALQWLENGRPYLKRPLICKDIQLTAKEIMESYLSFHSDLLEQTGSRIPPISPSEYMMAGKQMKKIGRNEKCPCGSNKKYKKCCMKGR